MDAIGALGAVVASFTVTSEVFLLTLDIGFRTVAHAINFYRLYGPSGLLLLLFGSKTTWRVEAQVLGRLDDQVAMDFRKSIQDECTMISTAAAITAQIAITALSLSSLSQTHWIVRGLSVFSLISALMAVYYATTQHRNLGRLLSAAQVRNWIRGGVGVPDRLRIIPSLGQILAAFPRLSALMSLVDMQPRYWSVMRFLLTIATNGDRFCDPEELNLMDINTDDPNEIKYLLMRMCFVPGVTSVISMSAPQILLSTSLVALLLALGVYLGFVWTRNLDTDAGLHDSRNVFIMYIVGLVVCIIVYSISQLIQNEDPRSEQTIIEDYLKDYVQDHPELLEKLGIQLVEHDEKVAFTKIVEQDGSHE